MSAGYIKLNSTDGGFQRDVDGRVLGDASHVRERLLGGQSGVNTTVVPPATEGGTPLGYDPHMVDDVVIHYDPGNPRATSKTVAEWREIQSQLPTKSGSAKSKAGKVIAAVQRSPVTPVYVEQAYEDNSDYSQQEVVQQAPRAAQMVPQRRLSPLEAVNQAVARKSAAQQVAPVQAQRPAAVAVTFEISGMGKLQAYYSTVLRSGNLLVLVFDHAAGSPMCYFPNFETADPDRIPQVALMLEDTGTVYLVETTNIQFRHDNTEYCVLLINQCVETE